MQVYCVLNVQCCISLSLSLLSALSRVFAEDCDMLNLSCSLSHKSPFQSPSGYTTSAFGNPKGIKASKRVSESMLSAK